MTLTSSRPARNGGCIKRSAKSVNYKLVLFSFYYLYVINIEMWNIEAAIQPYEKNSLESPVIVVPRIFFWTIHQDSFDGTSQRSTWRLAPLYPSISMTKCQSDQSLFQKERKQSRFRGSCFWGKPEEGFSCVGACARGFQKKPSHFPRCEDFGRLAMEAPTLSPSPHVICEGDWAVLKRGDVFKAVAVVKRR